MYHEIKNNEPKDPLERIKQKALRVIAQHGRLYWCSSKICGCMGCANTSMTREEYDQAITMPEVVSTLGRPARIGRGHRVKPFYLTNDFGA